MRLLASALLIIISLLFEHVLLLFNNVFIGLFASPTALLKISNMHNDILLLFGSIIWSLLLNNNLRISRIFVGFSINCFQDIIDTLLMIILLRVCGAWDNFQRVSTVNLLSRTKLSCLETSETLWRRWIILLILGLIKWLLTSRLICA